MNKKGTSMKNKMIYVSQLLEQEVLEEIMNEYPVGLEVISFSIGSVLDDLEASILHYKQAFSSLLNKSDISFHGPFLDLLPGSVDSRVRQLAMDRFEASYKAAQALGVRQMIFHTGYMPNTYIDKYWLENIISFWSEYLSDKDEHCYFYIENVLDVDCYLIKQLIDAVNKPNFKVCLDIGHVNAYSNKTIEEWICTLGNRIGYVHLHNNDGTKDAHQGLLCGNIKMQEVLACLKREAPFAKWCLEIGNEIMLKESLDWLQKQGFLN